MGDIDALKIWSLAQKHDHTDPEFVAALDAAEARAVVKPLVWDDWDNAEAVVGLYRVRAAGRVWAWTLDDDDVYLHGAVAANKVDAQAAVQADYDARIMSALHPASPLSAVAMRTRAADACTDIIKKYDVMKPDGVTYESMRVQKAAKGMVSLAREDIRALPLPAHAELLAAAAELDEVKALVDAASDVTRHIPDHADTVWQTLIEALAPFARKAGV